MHMVHTSSTSKVDAMLQMYTGDSRRPPTDASVLPMEIEMLVHRFKAINFFRIGNYSLSFSNACSLCVLDLNSCDLCHLRFFLSTLCAEVPSPTFRSRHGIDLVLYRTIEPFSG